jgi:hypothetical protein
LTVNLTFAIRTVKRQNLAVALYPLFT